MKQLWGRIIEKVRACQMYQRVVERTLTVESILGMVLQESMELWGSAECWRHQRHRATSCARHLSPCLSLPFLILAVLAPYPAAYLPQPPSLHRRREGRVNAALLLEKKSPLRSDHFFFKGVISCERICNRPKLFTTGCRIPQKTEKVR